MCEGLELLKIEDVVVGELNANVSVISCDDILYLSINGELHDINPQCYILKTQSDTYRYYFTDGGYICVSAQSYEITGIKTINGVIKVFEYCPMLLVDNDTIITIDMQKFQCKIVSFPKKINEYYIVCLHESDIYYYKWFDNRVIIHRFRELVNLEGFVSLTINYNGDVELDDLNQAQAKYTEVF